MNKKIGYKGFNVDNEGRLYCNPDNKIMYYNVGDTFSISGELAMYKNGIHFCWNLNDVHAFYNILDEVICEIEILGDILNDSDMKKSCTNKIKILRILTKEQIVSMSNTGECNTGIINSGNWNSGNHNSGNWNSGNWNSGYCNSGNRNSGNWNSGDRNSGYGNSGYCNSGNRNSGYGNSGYGNSGSCDGNVFCTKSHKCYIFDEISGITLEDFYNSKYYRILTKYLFPLTEWIEYTKEEKANDKAKELIGGYLKTNSYKYAWGEVWKQMTDEEKNVIQTIPNFNADKFEQITGIRIRA